MALIENEVRETSIGWFGNKYRKLKKTMIRRSDNVDIVIDNPE